MSSLLVSAPAYSGALHVRTHAPRKARPYAEYRDCLRLEFAFTCVYCLANEREVSPSDAYGGFEIEHLKPQGHPTFKRLRSYYPNLLWSCHACNRAKGDEWPTAEESANGYRFVDPTLEPMGSFLEISNDRVKAIDPGHAGEYMIDQINLNSGLHVGRRKRRRELMKAFATLEATADALRQRIIPGSPEEPALQTELDALLDAIEVHRRENGVPRTPPWDAPAECFACQPVKTKPKKRRR